MKPENMNVYVCKFNVFLFESMSFVERFYSL